MVWLRPSTFAALALFLVSDPARAAETLVTLSPGPTLDAFASRFVIEGREIREPDAWGYLSPSVKGAIQVLESTHRFRARQAFSKVLLGFYADLTEPQIEGLRYEPLVESITVTIGMSSARQQPQVPWGVARVASEPRPAGSDRGRVEDVRGVTVYVIDSGIDRANAELNVVKQVNFAGGPATDCNGHGTHVAGIIAARGNDVSVRGVAPGAPLVGVKVVDCMGNGSSASIIKGIDWVAATATGPSVVNLSLNGGVAPILDAAVKAASRQDIFFAIAAGNAASDACLSSPALNGESAGIVTVAVVDENDLEAPFSNYGGCVDIWAPGVSIPSTARGGKDGRDIRSGTSFAAPHVAGAAALYLSRNPEASPSAVESALIGSSVIPGTASKDGRTILRLKLSDP
jgi:subtilisin family serine protease